MKAFKNWIVVFASTIFATLTVLGQSNSLIIPSNISLPRDTVLKKQLITDLNGFLAQKEKPNKENIFVLKAYLLATSILLDEMKGMEKSLKLKVDTFYKAYLTNVLRVNDSTFKIQFAYLGVNEGVPLLRANFTILAQKKGNQFYFQSPLKQNTIAWKTQNFGNTKVYFKNKLNTAKAKECFKLTDEFDKKLKAPHLPTEFYCCDDFSEELQLMGVDYKADYNGRNYSTSTAFENDTHLVMNGTFTSDFTAFDPHDLWHSRLHNVVSVSIINKPVDEGAAFLYAGSWGLTWKQILNKFKTYAAANPNADWLALYNEGKNYDEGAKFPLNVDYTINAFIVQKIEKEKGFEAVMELLSCGKYQKGNENYFTALEKITGITKANFSATVWALIKAN